MGKAGEKKKEYINCNVYGKKAELARDFEKGEFIHVFGYYKEVEKEDKSYKNFIVKHLNKVDKTENTVNEEED
jgi:single-strand binding protein